MLTIEEEKVWDSFIEDFQNTLQDTNAQSYNTENSISISKKVRLVYLAWIISGALTGGIVGILISKYSGNKLLAYLSIPFFTTLFLKFRVNVNRRNNL